MIKKNLILLLAIFLLIISCKTKKIIHSFGKKFICLKLVSQDRYKYFYYNLGDTSFIYNYNVGRYLKVDKYYNLFPDSIDKDQFEFRCQQEKVNTIGSNCEIKIATNISGNYLNQYKILIFNDTVNLLFKGTNVDTMLRNIKLKNFRVKIILPDKYKIGQPTPSFSTITTKNINVENGVNSIFVQIPVEHLTFYYQYKKKILLKDSVNFWILNREKLFKDTTAIK